MNQNEALLIARELGPVSRHHAAEAVAPLAARVEALEARPLPVIPVSVRSATIDRENCLILSLSDGSTSNLGVIVGKDGVDGKDGLNGKDADPNTIKEIVAEAVSAIPPAKDGQDADPQAVAEIVKAEVLPQIERRVEEAVATLAAAGDGKGAVGPEEVQVLVTSEIERVLGDGHRKEIVGQLVKEEIEPLVSERVAAAAAALPIPKDGKDADPEEVARLVEEAVGKAVASIPPAKDGEKGEPGDLGLAPDHVADMVSSAIAMLSESPAIRAPATNDAPVPAALRKRVVFERDPKTHQIISAREVVDEVEPA